MKRSSAIYLVVSVSIILLLGIGYFAYRALNQNTQPSQTSNHIVLVSESKIRVGWDYRLNVSSYHTVYLYYSTTAGSKDAKLLVRFYVGQISDTGLHSEDIDLQIGFPSNSNQKLDVQGSMLYIRLWSMDVTPDCDWILTTLEIYLS